MSLINKIGRKLKRTWLEKQSLDSLQTKLARRKGALGLCYHTLDLELADYPYRTSPAAFDDHLHFLREIFDIVPVAEAVQLMRDGSLPDRERPIAFICFDDGYRDNWTVATGVLERHDVSACLFAARDLIRKGGSTHLNEADLIDLARHPLWQVESHAVTHNVLTGYRRPEQIAELRDCKDWLRELLGEDSSGFAYPQGQLSADIVELTRQYFEFALTTDVRLGDRFDRFQIRRHCPVYLEDSIEEFARSLIYAPMENGIN